MKHDFTIWRNQILQNPRDISPLKFGISQDEIIEIFGNPDAVSTMRSGGKPLILKYHDIELHFDMLTFTAMAWGGDTVGGVSLIDLRQKLKDITAQQALLLDQVLEHMDDEILNAQLKAMMDEKQALQERIADAEQSETHNAAQESRMAELREWMAKLEVNQQYSDEQVRMAVERITVVDAETIRIRFRYPGAELEKKL